MSTLFELIDYQISIGSKVLHCDFLSFEKGQMYFIHGASGEGKTLFMKSLFKNFSDLSPIYLGDHPFLETKKSVKDNLKLPYQLKAHNQLNFPFTSIESILRELKRSYLLERPIRTLSSGEKQILALIRALFLNYQLLLMDESLSSVDQETREALFELMANEFRRRNHTLIATGHHQVLSKHFVHLYVEKGKIFSPPPPQHQLGASHF